MVMRKLILLLLLSPGAQAELYAIDDFNLERFQGKVIYLDFWASWCKPCQKSFPWMNSLGEKYSAERFQVVTINLDQESGDMHRFLTRVPASFDIYHDPSGHIAEQFQLEGMPTSYLIDANGKVVNKHIGFYQKKIAEYEKEIEELL